MTTTRAMACAASRFSAPLRSLRPRQRSGSVVSGLISGPAAAVGCPYLREVEIPGALRSKSGGRSGWAMAEQVLGSTVVQHLNRAVDEVRGQTWRQLRGADRSAFMKTR